MPLNIKPGFNLSACAYAVKRELISWQVDLVRIDLLISWQLISWELISWKEAVWGHPADLYRAIGLSFINWGEPGPKKSFGNAN